MADRLPPVPTKAPDSFDDDVLTTLEAAIRHVAHTGDYRNKMLQQLHEKQISEFVHQPGFGRFRMLDLRPRGEYLRRNADPIRQPHPPQTLTPTRSEPFAFTLRPTPNTGGHENSIVDFVNPAGFGYFKNRNHVAGFQPHRMSEAPKFSAWDLKRVELVGLLMYPQPAVYVSNNLPRMDELRHAPTRSLDEVETEALKGLRAGQELLIAETPTGTRMVGAIRSAQQCTTCHDTPRGTLLGAFSYSLREPKR